MQYIIDPGLLPIATALSKDIAGKKVLVTRKVAARDDDKGVVGHLDGFGVRIMMYLDEAAGETIVEWACLYGMRLRKGASAATTESSSKVSTSAASQESNHG